MGVTVELAVFLAGTFVAACISGMAGFGYALIASAIWLHALPPILAAPLTVAYGLLVQVYAFWKLRGSFNYPRLMPFVVGGTLGVPAGVWLLAWASPTHLRIGTGVFLVIFRRDLSPALRWGSGIVVAAFLACSAFFARSSASKSRIAV